jgi:UDP-N-acetylmuramoyl-tripeptide--D-alanyl-D-alanine ligase
MMSSLALADIAVATDGCLVGQADCQNICTDTRKLQRGDLYIALVGENFDGNDFVEQAASSGAVAAIVSRKPQQNIPYVLVDDTRMALGQIAKMNRRQFCGPVIALTGSTGKSTCKEMIASILAESGSVLVTRGNLNNEIGVPLTLLEISPEHQYAVIEMGASRSGDIGYLAGFTEANIALVTNAMPAHVASFGNVETIAKTKGELFENLPADGVAVINLDDEFYAQWCQQAAQKKIISFSKKNTAADVYAGNIRLRSDGASSFSLYTPVGDIEIALPLLGEHNVVNALAAAAVALAAGISLQHIQKGLSKVAAMAGRLKPIQIDELTIIDDSYNASPGSVKAAIDVLAAVQGRRCLLLGTMGELGPTAELLHREVARYAREKNIEQLIVVGEFASVMKQEFGAAASAFEASEKLLAELGSTMQAKTVLVKGSRFMRMERFVSALCQLAKSQQGKS